MKKRSNPVEAFKQNPFKDIGPEAAGQIADSLRRAIERAKAAKKNAEPPAAPKPQR